jgi:hypothetical protein
VQSSSSLSFLLLLPAVMSASVQAVAGWRDRCSPQQLEALAKLDAAAESEGSAAVSFGRFQGLSWLLSHYVAERILNMPLVRVNLCEVDARSVSSTMRTIFRQVYDTDKSRIVRATPNELRVEHLDSTGAAVTSAADATTRLLLSITVTRQHHNEIDPVWKWATWTTTATLDWLRIEAKAETPSYAISAASTDCSAVQRLPALSQLHVFA